MSKYIAEDVIGLLCMEVCMCEKKIIIRKGREAFPSEVAANKILKKVVNDAA